MLLFCCSILLICLVMIMWLLSLLIMGICRIFVVMMFWLNVLGGCGCWWL